MDLLYNDNGLIIENGDFKVGFSDSQDIERILTTHKGENPLHPLLGVGMSRYLKAPTRLSDVKREINRELISDGFNLVSVDYDEENQEINVNATRKNGDS